MVSVNTILSYTVFSWFMLLMIVRRIVLVSFAAINSRYRASPDITKVPEDMIMKPKELQTPIQSIGSVVYSKELRSNLVITDDAENDPYFLLVLLATAIVSDNVSDPCTRTIVYGTVYFAARFSYTVCYVLGFQPWRTLCYVAGLMCTFACSLDLVVTMSSKSN